MLTAFLRKLSCNHTGCVTEVSRAVAAMSYYGDDRGRPWRGGGGGRHFRRGFKSSYRDNHRRPRRDETDDTQTDEHEHHKRPPGLSGREIGMYYARKSRATKKKREAHQRPVVSLDNHMERKIRNLLGDIDAADKVQPQPARSGASMDDDFTGESNVRPSTSYSRGHHHDNSTRPQSAFESWRSGGGQSSYNRSTRTVSQGDAWNNWRENDSEGMETSPDVEMTHPTGDKEAASFDDDPAVSSLEELMKYYEDETEYNVSEDVKQEFKDDLLGKINKERDTGLDEFLKLQAESRETNPTTQKMMEFRKKLPSYSKQKEIVDLLATHQCLVVSGETGCGKTTQVPQFILDDYISRGEGSLCRIICTQPRRISAISVSKRVAEERGQKVGNKSDVGYSIRLERQLPRDRGSILFCTTGILIKYLERDPNLMRATHIVIDEIHERDLLADFLMIILKDLLPKRPNLKVILMSATLNARQFSEYYNNCPMLEIPGFTYPVTEYWLEDVVQMTGYQPTNPLALLKDRDIKKQKEEHGELVRWTRTLDSKKFSLDTIQALTTMNTKYVDPDLVCKLIRHICFKINEDGAILVFVPGWAEIKAIHEKLLGDTTFNNSNFKIIPLHSLMPTVNQREVFDRPWPGVRKIIIATNIAETSITIDDVVYVIDCGLIKVKDFDPKNNISTLDTRRVARANARQRKGRAGRVQEGHCFHLYTRHHQENLIPYIPPEILRTRLEELCLMIKLQKLGKIEPFLSKAMDRPDLDTLHMSITSLQNLKALDSDENLLPLGYHLAKMPVDPQSGKMILFGAMFGCLDPICTVVASLNFKSPFMTPLGKEAQVDRAKLKLAEDSKSDHIMLINAFKGWENARARGTDSHYCWDHFLSPITLKLLKEMKKQFGEMLYDLKFIRNRNPADPAFNINSDNHNLIRAIVCAGLYPNVAKAKSRGRSTVIERLRKFHLKDSVQSAEIHPGSVNKLSTEFNSCWFIYHQLMLTSSRYLYDTTMVSPYPLLFFGGEIGTSVDEVDGESKQTITVDDWISFWAAPSTAQLIQDLRRQLDRILEEKITQPGMTDWRSKSREVAILRAIIDLVTKEEVIPYNDLSTDTRDRRSTERRERRERKDKAFKKNVAYQCGE